MCTGELGVTDAEQRLLVRVALLYYEENLTQEEIAARLALSRSKVVRLLQEARRTGVVQIRVLAPHDWDRELERRLEQRFGLLQAAVAAPARPTPEVVRAAVAHEAVSLLSPMLKPGLVLGMASGTTMQAVVDAMPAVRLPGARVVEMQGILIPSETLHELDTLQVSRMAQRLGAEYVMLPVPREVSSPEVAAALRMESRVGQTLDLARRAKLLLVGIGAIPLSPSLAHLAEELVTELRQVGAVGEIGARFYDVQGRPTASSFDDRLIGLELHDLLRVPMRIGVAFGEHKTSAIAGALAGHYVNTLVTDVDTARSLLEYVGAQIDERPALARARDGRA
jgi:DNA-binding transcriptional regulator LsrR (DeoR family)